MRSPREKLLRLLTAAICLAWLGSFVYLLGARRYLFFLARSYWGLLALGIAAFGAFALAVAARGLPACHFGRSRWPWVSLAVCLLPLALLVANPRPMPSSYTLAMRSRIARLWKSHIVLGLGGRSSLQATRPAATAPAAASLPASRPAASDAREALPATPLDIVLRYPDNVGRRVVTEGMVFRKAHLPPKTLVVFRFVITCCAADAVPAAVLVASDQAEAFPIDSWVRVRGHVERTTLGGLDIPLLRAEHVQPISPPPNPYLD